VREVDDVLTQVLSGPRDAVCEELGKGLFGPAIDPEEQASSMTLAPAAMARSARAAGGYCD
jgi:hypothetical protein